MRIFADATLFLKARWDAQDFDGSWTSLSLNTSACLASILYSQAMLPRTLTRFASCTFNRR